MESEQRTIWNCTRCGHQWFSHNNNKPVLCAKCKNCYWNVPRKIESREGGMNDRNEQNKGIIEN